MLRSLKDLEGYRVRATDGELGTVSKFLLEDDTWTVRYLVVHAGTFFNERDVLISPRFFRKAEWSERVFHLALTRKMIRESPGVDADLPVSRQHERDYFRYYGFPNYWGSTGVWGVNAAPPPEPEPEPGAMPQAGPGKAEPPDDDDPHLRSASYLRGYHIHGTDGEVGHVDDFIVDDSTWRICYLVVTTSNWWVGQQVLIPPFWATQVSWDENMIYLSLTRQEIKESPEWDASAPINRAYEARLFDYYGRPVYWDPHDSPTEAREEII